MDSICPDCPDLTECTGICARLESILESEVKLEGFFRFDESINEKTTSAPELRVIAASHLERLCEPAFKTTERDLKLKAQFLAFMECRKIVDLARFEIAPGMSREQIERDEETVKKVKCRYSSLQRSLTRKLKKIAKHLGADKSVLSDAQTPHQLKMGLLVSEA